MLGAFAALSLAFGFLGILGSAGLGCKSSLPPTSTMVLTPCPTPILFAGFEDLTSYKSLSNGVSYYVSNSGITFNDPGSSSAPFAYTATLTQSKFYPTQGQYSLDININTAVAYNQNILILTFANPIVWNNITALTMDLTVDPSVVAGASYGYFQFVADSDAANLYFRSITNSNPSLSAGTQTITWNINYSAGPLVPTDTINKLTFIYNRSTPSAGQGIGNIFIDNLQLHQNCPN